MSGTENTGESEIIHELPYNIIQLKHIPDGEKSEWFWQRWAYWRQNGHGRSAIIAYWLLSFLEFLLHHFFVLSGSTRIYLISFFLLFGGTFYAVAPTVVLGTAFFIGSVVISLLLSSFSHAINERIDQEDLEKQRAIHQVNSLYAPISEEKKELKSNTAIPAEKSCELPPALGLPTERLRRLSSGAPAPTGLGGSPGIAESNTKGTPGDEAHLVSPWPRIDTMEKNSFSWLNYKGVLDRTKSNYPYVIYFMDFCIVVAASWNIIEEVLRWQAVLPFASVLTAMGPFWVIFSLSALAALCLGLKMLYTHPITQLRAKNVDLLQTNRNIFEGTLKHNATLREAFNRISKAKELENKAAVLEKVDETNEITPANTRNLALMGGAFFGAALTIGVCAALPATVPLGSIITFSMLCFGILFKTGYESLKWSITHYELAKQKKADGRGGFLEQFWQYKSIQKEDFKNDKILEDLDGLHRTKKQIAALKKPKIERTERWEFFAKLGISLGISALFDLGIYAVISSGLPLGSISFILAVSTLLITTGVYRFLNYVVERFEQKEKSQERAKENAIQKRETIVKKIAAVLHAKGSTYTKDQIETLTRFAYSLWKLKHMHEFKPQRNLIESFIDNIAVPFWNTIVTILPTFFIINGIFFYVFGLPSVLACWPLFVIELIPAILLAIDFGQRKLGDNKHDLIKDAACLIIEEIANETKGTLSLCTQAGIGLQEFGLVLVRDPKVDKSLEVPRDAGGPAPLPLGSFDNARNADGPASEIIPLLPQIGL